MIVKPAWAKHWYWDSYIENTFGLLILGFISVLMSLALGKEVLALWIFGAIMFMVIILPVLLYFFKFRKKKRMER